MTWLAKWEMSGKLVKGMKRVRRRWIAFFVILALTPMAGTAQAENRHFWQLTLAYTSSSLVLKGAAEIPPLKKKVKTPGLAGGPFKIKYQVDWLDETGKLLATTGAEFPLGVRGILSPQGEVPAYIPMEGIVIVRLHGPPREKSPASIRLRRSNIQKPTLSQARLPGIFEREEIILPFEGLILRGEPLPLAGPVSVTKIRDTGSDANRLVMVLCGDGYTATDLQSGMFTAAANQFLDAFQYASPWDVLFSNTNIYRIDVESNQEGADRFQSQTAPIVDTYFNSTYWSYGISYLLTIDSVGRQRAIAAANQWVGAGIWDIILINVNCAAYGGSGGAIVVFSNDASSNEIVLHELGHIFAGLADEYSAPYPGYPSGDSEPNVDFDFSGSGLKWLNWVTPGAPLPTPNQPEYASVVGAFEGARYLEYGIYRPCLDCKMKELGIDFCPICKEANVINFFDLVQLSDQETPPTGTNINVPGAGATFSLLPINLEGLRYAWSLDSVAWTSATESSLTLFPWDLAGSGNHTLEVDVSYPTPMVRKNPILSTYSWLVATTSGNTGASCSWTLYR